MLHIKNYEYNLPFNQSIIPTKANCIKFALAGVCLYFWFALNSLYPFL